MRRFAFVTTVYFLIFGYAQLTAAGLVFPGWRPGTPELLVLLVGPAAGWLVHQARRNEWTRWVQRAVYLWLGLGFLLLCVVVPVQLLRLLGLPDGSAAVLLVAACAPLAIWSIVNAHRLAVRQVALSSPRLDRTTRLVQISDVHVGSRGPGFLPRIVRRVNALAPDAVFVTGDLVDLMKLPDDALDPMGALAAPLVLRHREPRALHRKRCGLRAAGGAWGDGAARRANRMAGATHHRHRRRRGAGRGRTRARSDRSRRA